METISFHLNSRKLRPLVGLLLLLAIAASSSFISPAQAATHTDMASCPSLAGHLAPDEAKKAALAYPISLTLTRYAMGLAAFAANRTPTLPPPAQVFVPVPNVPAPPLAQVEQAASACGYPGRVRGIAVSAPFNSVDDAVKFTVEVANPKLRGSAAIGVGAAFDRFGQLHLVYLGGTVNDNTANSDPFSAYTEDKPANPLPRPTGFAVLLSVGPYCSKHVCGYDHPRGGIITVYRGTRVVGRGVSNRQGIAEIVVPGPGRYTIASSFLDRGRRYHSKSSGFPAMAGLIMPVTLTGCAPGDSC
jgi:hypothetical protein